MINTSMVKNPIVVKAKRINTNDNEYYLEFELDEAQKSGLLAEMMLAHVKEGRFLMVEKFSEQDNISHDERKANFIKKLLDENPDMHEAIRNDFYRQLIELMKPE